MPWHAQQRVRRRARGRRRCPTESVAAAIAAATASHGRALSARVSHASTQTQIAAIHRNGTMPAASPVPVGSLDEAGVDFDPVWAERKVLPMTPVRCVRSCLHVARWCAVAGALALGGCAGDENDSAANPTTTSATSEGAVDGAGSSTSAPAGEFDERLVCDLLTGAAAAVGDAANSPVGLGAPAEPLIDPREVRCAATIAGTRVELVVVSPADGGQFELAAASGIEGDPFTLDDLGDQAAYGRFGRDDGTLAWAAVQVADVVFRIDRRGPTDADDAVVPLARAVADELKGA